MSRAIKGVNDDDIANKGWLYTDLLFPETGRVIINGQSIRILLNRREFEKIVIAI